MDKMLEQLENLLTEAPKRTSRTRVTRKTKIKRSTGQMASAEARKRNDPLYKRMIYYRELYYKYRAAVHKKYAPRVRSRARR
jgi:hypothetical protein